MYMIVYSVYSALTGRVIDWAKTHVHRVPDCVHFYPQDL